MKPIEIEDLIRQEAEKVKLGEYIDPYGYENLENEILLSVFTELRRRHPRVLQAIIRDNLDFFLAPVEEPTWKNE